MIALSVTIEFVPLSLVVCDGEVLQSFFDKDEAVVAILISWVLHWYYVDVRDSQTGGSVVKVCKV